MTHQGGTIWFTGLSGAGKSYRQTREEVKAGIAEFVEVFFDCPLDVLTARDPKGLYRRALAGQILHFTGVSDPYEPPLAPDIMIRTDIESETASADRIWVELVRRGLIQP